jgi:NADPH:quinone reductase-like Zn-dependent oxidoreductase
MRGVAVSRFHDIPRLMDLPVPRPGPHEILVRVSFAGVNPLDWKVIEGLYDGSRPHLFPLVLGVDGAGTVEAIGPEETQFRVGDRVFGQFLHSPVGTGTYVDFTLVPEDIGVDVVPEELKPDEAAALPTAGMTALTCLDSLSLKPGDSLVIVGASGGVGSFATELAAGRGFHVTVVARPNSAARLRSLGAEIVVDPSGGDTSRVLEESGVGRPDGLLDLMSDSAAFRAWSSVVRKGGVAVTTTYSADEITLRQAGLRGGNVELHPTRELLGRLARELVDHHLRIPVERRVRLTEATAALADLRAGRGSGKTVVDLAG